MRKITNYYKIKKFIRKTAFIVPITLLAVSFISAFINYTLNGYILLGNTSGYSLLVDYAFLAFYTFNKKYCDLTRFSPIGLIIINTIDIIACFLDPSFYTQYSFWYTTITSAIIFGLVGILEIKKRINKWLDYKRV